MNYWYLLGLVVVVSISAAVVLMMSKKPSNDGDKQQATVYDSFVVTEKISNCYSQCSLGSLNNDPTTWDTADYCGFNIYSNCDKQNVADYACVPACLENCPNVFCDTMSTLVLNCDGSSAEGSFSSKADLQAACVASYAASAETLTVLSFETSTSLAGVSAASVREDEAAQYAARVSIASAMSNIPVSQVNITNITDVVDRRRLRAGAHNFPRQLVGTGANIEFAILAELEQLGFTSSQATEVYELLVGQVEESINSGEFVENLKTNSDAGGSATLAAVEAVEASQPQAEAISVVFVRTASPTNNPTVRPSSVPTVAPSARPTARPSAIPTLSPSASPTVSGATLSPTLSPTEIPTVQPTAVPSTAGPSTEPTSAPTDTAAPTETPTQAPTVAPTNTASPTEIPTAQPTAVPSTAGPSTEPTSAPTDTAAPTETPTQAPTAVPITVGPTAQPTVSPTGAPSSQPSDAPLGFLWAACAENTGAYLSNSTLSDAAVDGYPVSLAPFPKVEEAQLPASEPNLLLTLQWVRAGDCSVLSVARSYGGLEWEGEIRFCW